MNESQFAFAVGSVRVREAALFTKEELLLLAGAKDLNDALRRVNEKGYGCDERNFSEALEQCKRENWAYLSGLLPRQSDFDSILIKNDFQNLKVLLKALVTEKQPDALYAYPSVYDPEALKAHVFRRENDKLPAPLQHADRSAYNILTKTGFAQLADSVIDRAGLEWSLKLAAESGYPVLTDYAETSAAVTDIRVLWRSVKAGKAESFMGRAVCACAAFDKGALIAAAGEGEASLLSYLSHTDYADLAAALSGPPAVFERLCDERISRTLSDGKSGAFGIAPLLRYYFAFETQVRNIRIVLSCKKNGLPDDNIRERMRLGYA